MYVCIVYVLYDELFFIYNRTLYIMCGAVPDATHRYFFFKGTNSCRTPESARGRMCKNAKEAALYARVEIHYVDFISSPRSYINKKKKNNISPIQLKYRKRMRMV